MLDQGPESHHTISELTLGRDAATNGHSPDKVVWVNVSGYANDVYQK
jgi:hypothetical protein